MHALKLILIISVSVFLTACGDEWKDRHSTRTAQDSSLAEAMFADVYAQVFNPGNLGSENYKMAFGASCPVVTIEPFDGTFPVTVTIDFGTTNCTQLDGKPRRGVLVAELDGAYREPGTTIIVTPDNYHVNDILVEGIQTVKNLGKNSVGNLHFSVKEENGRIHSENGLIKWASERTREWVEGASTATPWDDVYHITGTATGTDSEGRGYTLEVIDPLRVAVGCRWITKGILDVKPENLETRRIDYGNGDCNGTAKVSVGGFEFTVIVP